VIIKDVPRQQAFQIHQQACVEPGRLRRGTENPIVGGVDKDLRIGSRVRKTFVDIAHMELNGRIREQSMTLVSTGKQKQSYILRGRPNSPRSACLMFFVGKFKDEDLI
jgi:hypothetical protein